MNEHNFLRDPLDETGDKQVRLSTTTCSCSHNTEKHRVSSAGAPKSPWGAGEKSHRNNGAPGAAVETNQLTARSLYR